MKHRMAQRFLASLLNRPQMIEPASGAAVLAVLAPGARLDGYDGEAANPQIPASALAAGYQAPTAAVPAAAGLSSYLGTAGIGLGTGMLLGGWLGTKSNSKVVGGLTGAASGAATGALAGTFLFPGIGTAVGAIIGAITGGLGGLLGTQKKATQYGGGWIDTNDAGRITRSASGGENGINGNDLLDRARAVNDVLRQVNRAAGISYGSLRISTEYHEDKGHSTLIGGWEGRKASSAEDPGMIALDILRAFAKDNSLAAQYNFQAPEVVLKALRNMGDVDQETGAKILAVAAAVHEGNSALDTYIKSLSGVTKAARKSIKDSLEPMKDELDLAKQGGIEADWKAMAERQFRAIWDTASSSFTAVETALAELDGTFQAYGETIKDLNLSITEAELAAAKAAQVAKMRSDYAKTQDGFAITHTLDLGGRPVTATNGQFIAMARAQAAHVQACFDRWGEIWRRLDAATTWQEVVEVYEAEIDQGWPGAA